MTQDVPHCTACRNGEERLSAEEAKRQLGDIPGWELNTDATKIRREFMFKNWKQAFAFATRLSELAEQEKHHPDLELGWGYCHVTLQTHAIGGLHNNDFIMATQINLLADAV